MNYQGLFFDAFLTPPLEITLSKNKPDFRGEIFDKFMSECATVNEVLELLDIDIRFHSFTRPSRISQGLSLQFAFRIGIPWRIAKPSARRYYVCAPITLDYRRSRGWWLPTRSFSGDRETQACSLRLNLNLESGTKQLLHSLSFLLVSWFTQQEFNGKSVVL